MSTVEGMSTVFAAVYYVTVKSSRSTAHRVVFRHTMLLSGSIEADCRWSGRRTRTQSRASLRSPMRWAAVKCLSTAAQRSRRGSGRSCQTFVFVSFSSLRASCQMYAEPGASAGAGVGASGRSWNMVDLMHDDFSSWIRTLRRRHARGEYAALPPIDLGNGSEILPADVMIRILLTDLDELPDRPRRDRRSDPVVAHRLAVFRNLCRLRDLLQ
jgi:hypothetical protein